MQIAELLLMDELSGRLMRKQKSYAGRITEDMGKEHISVLLSPQRG